MNKNLNIKKNEKKSDVGFLTLFKIFKLKVVRHFISTLIVTILISFIYKTSEVLILSAGSNFFSLHSSCSSNHSHNSSNSFDDQKNNVDHQEILNGNYISVFNFLPRKDELKKFFQKNTLNKKEFVLLLSFIIAFCCLIRYYDSFWESDLASESSMLLKNRLLEKFRSLEFEKKIEKKDEIKLLAEVESDTIGNSWEHLYNHVFHSFISIIMSIILNFKELKEKMNKSSLIFFTFWCILINVVYSYILSISINKENEHKDKLTKEISFIDKEISKSLLIESMGFSSLYRNLQQKITKENETFKKLINKLGFLNSSISFFLIEIYIYMILAFSSGISSLSSIYVFYNISHQLGEILNCFREYGSYSSACWRVNEFLNISEKNENIDKPALNSRKIKEIIFSNVDFKYSSGDKLILNKYNRVFSISEINNLVGKNGTGKSTIIYLALGMLKPLRGNIFIKFENEKILDLNKDVNIKDWKENIVAYCSHDNLVDEGSTGQRQIKNIKEVIKNKRKSKIFIFDEASNALDKSKQNFLSVQIEKLIKDKKIVIFVKH